MIFVEEVDDIFRLALSPFIDWLEPNDFATLTVVTGDTGHASVCEHTNLTYPILVLVCLHRLAPFFRFCGQYPISQ